MPQYRGFIPEIETFHLERQSLRHFIKCNKKENHDKYLSPQEIELQNLPPEWRSEENLYTLKIISKSIVHLTVLKKSPSRPGMIDNGSGQSCGSGFLTFHPRHGAIVHTSKHVVYDQFEARWTVVRLFHDDEDNVHTVMAIDNFNSSILSDSNEIGRTSGAQLELKMPYHGKGLFLSRGKQFFRPQPWCDYTAFTCDFPIHELFSETEVSYFSGAFSWSNFSFKKLAFKSNAYIDIAIISHPHGAPKKISFGKMDRLVCLTHSLYDLPTCAGSSGSPIISLNVHAKGLISFGQFIHYGTDNDPLNKGIGMMRPPYVFLYHKSEASLAKLISTIHELVSYLLLFTTDFLHIENLFFILFDIFTYISTAATFLYIDKSSLYEIRCAIFGIHIFLVFLVAWWRSSVCHAIAKTIQDAIAVFLLFQALHILFFAPWFMDKVYLVEKAWVLILCFERYCSFEVELVRDDFGSFPDIIHYVLRKNCSAVIWPLPRLGILNGCRKMFLWNFLTIIFMNLHTCGHYEFRSNPVCLGGKWFHCFLFSLSIFFILFFFQCFYEFLEKFSAIRKYQNEQDHGNKRRKRRPLKGKWSKGYHFLIKRIIRVIKK